MLEQCSWRKQRKKNRKVVISTETQPENIMQSFILSYTPHAVT